MLRILRIADCPPVPWKNGAGTTRELWALRDEAGAPLVRISIAAISGDQAFSVFPEIDRVILQLDGPAMVLTIDGIAHPLTALAPLAFPGEAAVACALKGKGTAHDLNLMCRRGDFVADMRPLETAAGATLAIGEDRAITALLALGPTTLDHPLGATLNMHDILLADGRFALQTARTSAFIQATARLATSNAQARAPSICDGRQA